MEFNDGRLRRARLRWGEMLPRTVVLALGVAAAAGGVFGAPPEHDADRIFFSKSFPGSVPEYFEVTVDSAGNASYREAPGEDPLEFQMAEGETRAVFELAEKLNRFRGQLQSERKVAFTGEKILRYSSAAGEETEVRFSYTMEPDAQAIVDWFERAGETERRLIELERVIRFDRLGINKTLLLFQASFDDGRVLGARQFLPILKSIAEDGKVMHMARARAASLVERIERGDP